MIKMMKMVLSVLSLLVGLPFIVWAAGFIIFTGTVCSFKIPRNVEARDAAIVLTGGSNRVAGGFDLLADHHIKNLLISGAGKNVTRHDLVRQTKYAKPLPACCITVGHEAGNTIGNAAEARKWLQSVQAKSIYIVTSNYHMPRALVEFRHALGKDIILAPYPVQPEDFDPKQQGFWKLAFLEYHKYLVTVLRVNAYPNETNPLPQAFTQ